MKRHNLPFALVIPLFLLLLPLFSSAEKKEEVNTENSRAESIKQNNLYYYGIGYGNTMQEADRMAVEDMCGKISMSVSGSSVAVDTNDDEVFTARTAISTFVTLSNSEKIELSNEEGNFGVMRYVKRQQVAEDMKKRADRVKSLIEQGVTQEKQLMIAGALKYFNWALALAQSCTTPINLEIDGKTVEAISWLDAHINTIFNTLEFKLQDAEMTNDELDPYLVNITVTFLGEPVGDLDYSYFNNTFRVTDQHIKNGRASLFFEALPKNELEISVEYKYIDEGKQFDPELNTIFSAHKPRTFKRATYRIPCRGLVPSKFTLLNIKRTKEERAEAERLAQMAPARIAHARKRVETNSVKSVEAVKFFDAMKQVSSAIDTGKYSSVSQLFTEEGFELFSMMMKSGKVRNARKIDQSKKIDKDNPPFRLETSGDFIIGKSLPVTITYARKHTVSEDIVFRFNSDGLIESVAYALTKRAEDDIFRQNSWDLSARYAIMQFMEDYQTAYSLKRLDYIAKIFSDDAIIITGKKSKKRQVATNTEGKGYFITAPYTFTRQTKTQYLNNLRKDFAYKKYIKHIFEENEIREHSGLYQNIYWIEIKQQYLSDTYKDIGYLALMIDMRKEDPVIKVRTWAPDKMPLADLMNSFTVE